MELGKLALRIKKSGLHSQPKHVPLVSASYARTARPTAQCLRPCPRQCN